MEDLGSRVERALDSPGGLEARLYAALSVVADRFGAQIGTLHLLDPEGKTLLLKAFVGAMPPAVLEASRAVPVGKGMAGLAASRREPVSTCDLQTDASGVARPGARATGLRGTLCVPMLDAKRLGGTLGIGCEEERVFTPEETAALLDAGSRIARTVFSA